MVDEAPKFDVEAVKELRTALLQVIASVNEIDLALLDFCKEVRFSTRSQRGFGTYEINHLTSRLERHLRDVQPRLRTAIDILVKEDPKMADDNVSNYVRERVARGLGEPVKRPSDDPPVGGGPRGPEDSDMFFDVRIGRLEAALEGLKRVQDITVLFVLGVGALLLAISLYSLTKARPAWR